MVEKSRTPRWVRVTMLRMRNRWPQQYSNNEFFLRTVKNCSQVALGKQRSRVGCKFDNCCKEGRREKYLVI